MVPVTSTSSLALASSTTSLTPAKTTKPKIVSSEAAQRSGITYVHWKRKKNRVRVLVHVRGTHNDPTEFPLTFDLADASPDAVGAAVAVQVDLEQHGLHL
jgi:hypothetical protein